MKLSKNNFTKIGKIEKNISTVELLESANFIKQVSTGSYVYLHLMQETLNNLNKIIRQEMNLSCMEIGLSQLQSADLWKKTSRYELYGEEMFRFKDRKNRDMILAGTNEELVTHLASQKIASYRDTNFTWYCISNKFRDEIRAYNGLERCKEFVMLDAYSFHDTLENLQIEYANIRQAFCNIFDKLGLVYEIKKADNGEIGGSLSEEFIIDDLEVAHIFQLEDKYSKALDCTYVDDKNQSHYVMMGCYGIGISRLLQCIAHTKRSGNFINWGKVAAYEYGIVIANINDLAQVELANKIYESLKFKRTYLDDRNLKLGEKLNEIDVIGTFNKIIVGRKAAQGIVEMKNYDTWQEINYENIFL